MTNTYTDRRHAAGRNAPDAPRQAQAATRGGQGEHQPAGKTRQLLRRKARLANDAKENPEVYAARARGHAGLEVQRPELRSQNPGPAAPRSAR